MARASIRFVRTTAPQVASRRPPYELRKMNMLAIVFVAGLCAIGLAGQFLRWKRGRASSQFVLVILPAACCS